MSLDHRQQLPPSVTEQIANARRLADYLDKVAEEWPEHFDMASYVMADDPPDSKSDSKEWNLRFARHIDGEHPVSCGTIACALGWAPYALGEPKGPDEHWTSYAEHLFGTALDGLRPDGSSWYDWLFGADRVEDRSWAPEGAEGARAAARRLRVYADHVEAVVG